MQPRPRTPPASEGGRLCVLLVAENISLRQSGETSVPWYYLERFVAQGVDVRAVCHARVRDALRQDLPPALFERVSFVEDSWAQKLVYALGRRFHYRIEDLVFGQLIHLLTQMRLRALVKRLVRTHAVDIVFEPVPISPRTPSFMFRLGVPVVVGPMCGGLELPPAFRAMDGPIVTWSIRGSRMLAGLMHRVVPGKRDAAALIVGNQRTARALPRGVRGRIYEVVESGVDLARWPPKRYPVQAAPGTPVRFVFCGRLVDWKGAQYLVRAFEPLARRGGAVLDLIGDGELAGAIARQVHDAGIGHAVVLHGRVPLERCIALMTAGDVYVMPSLRECGGLALLEAMAIGLPVVATNWMGPAEYLDAGSAILVDAGSEQALVDGFTAAMERLAASPALRRTLGEGARRRAFGGYFGWDSKVARVIEILREVLDAPSGRPAHRTATGRDTAGRHKPPEGDAARLGAVSR